MADFRIEFSKEAFKTYKKLENHVKKRIDKILTMLMEGKRIDLQPIQGTNDLYRIRTGNYRLIFKKIKEDKVYLVFKIGSRGDVYKNI